MSTQITTAFVQQYNDNVTMLSQQKVSRLRGNLREEPIHGKFEYFDQIGAATAQKRTSRHADTPFTETPHARRQVYAEDYEYADLVDKADKIRILNDPTSEYAMAGAMAMGRSMDDVVIAAALGSSNTGETGSTAVVLPSGQQIGASASGLTLSKLLQAREILDAAENDPDEQRFIICPAKDVTVLLNTTEVKSSDYNTVKSLVQGQIDTFCGFKFIRSQRLGISTVDSSSRACFAWRKSALLLAVGDLPVARITERADKSYSTQVYYMNTFGATRMEEVGVVQIDTTA